MITLCGYVFFMCSWSMAATKAAEDSKYTNQLAFPSGIYIKHVYQIFIKFLKAFYILINYNLCECTYMYYL